MNERVYRMKIKYARKTGKIQKVKKTLDSEEEKRKRLRSREN